MSLPEELEQPPLPTEDEDMEDPLWEEPEDEPIDFEDER